MGSAAVAAAQKAILIHNGRPQCQQQPVLERQGDEAGRQHAAPRALERTGRRAPAHGAVTDHALPEHDRRRYDRHAHRRRGNDADWTPTAITSHTPQTDLPHTERGRRRSG